MLDIIHISEDEKWDEVVKSFKTYDVYYLSGYVKAFEVHGDGIPELFYYCNEKIRAINVVMKRKINNCKYFKDALMDNDYYDIVTPYGYGGFIIEGEYDFLNINKLNKEYLKYCNDNNIVSEFVRFHPILNNNILCNSIYDVKKMGNTVAIELKSKDYIWCNFTSKNRNAIRKAIKSGVKIYWGRSKELLNKFIPLYTSTMHKDNARDYYYFNKDFYNSIVQDLRYNFLFFYAVFNEEIISMAIVMFANKNMHYHLSASNIKYNSLAPTNLLLYEVACWGYNNGFDNFHLGGGLGSNEDSLYKFKKAFNKNSNTYFSIGKKIFNKEKYEKLLDIRLQKINCNLDTDYFPRYRSS